VSHGGAVGDEQRPDDRLVVGLGNPGSRYAATRHNAGYRVVERLWQAHGAGTVRQACGMEFQIGQAPRSTVVMARSLTYMNESGRPVADLMAWLVGTPSALLVIHDDLDLPVGTTRFRRGGTSGGHRGVQSLIEVLNTEEFARLKIGVGRPGEIENDVVEFVLSPPAGPEAEILDAAETVAAEAAWRWVTDGIDVCMSLFNGRIVGAEEGEP
jgi:peptidyl-tRNA hydrolase, PTH1 family